MLFRSWHCRFLPQSGVGENFLFCHYYWDVLLLLLLEGPRCRRLFSVRVLKLDHLTDPSSQCMPPVFPHCLGCSFLPSDSTLFFSKLGFSEMIPSGVAKCSGVQGGTLTRCRCRLLVPRQQPSGPTRYPSVLACSESTCEDTTGNTYIFVRKRVIGSYIDRVEW